MPPETAAVPAESPARLQYGAPVTLAPGEAVLVEQSAVRVRFVRVVEDSRCPRDVTCVWAGRAVVELTATVGEDGPERSVQLEVGASAAASATAAEGSSGSGAAELFGFRFVAEALDPYPEAKEAVRPENYRLRLALAPRERGAS